MKGSALRECCVIQCCFVVLSGANATGATRQVVESTQAVFYCAIS